MSLSELLKNQHVRPKHFNKPAWYWKKLFGQFSRTFQRWKCLKLTWPGTQFWHKNVFDALQIGKSNYLTLFRINLRVHEMNHSSMECWLYTDFHFTKQNFHTIALLKSFQWNDFGKNWTISAAAESFKDLCHKRQPIGMQIFLNNIMNYYFLSLEWIPIITFVSVDRGCDVKWPKRVAITRIPDAS